MLDMTKHLLENHAAQTINGSDRVTTSLRSDACYDFVQRDSNGVVCRGRVVECLIYPTFDIRHFSILESVLKSDSINYSVIRHNLDKQYCDTAIVKKDDNDLLFDRTDLSFYVPPDDVFYKLKKEHYHLVVYRQHTTTNTAFAKNYGLNSNMVRVYGCLTDRLAYQTHAFNDDKHRYDINDICATKYMFDHYKYGIDSVKLTTSDMLKASEKILRNGLKVHGYINMCLARDLLDDEHMGHFFIKEYYKIRDIVLTLQHESDFDIPDPKLRKRAIVKEQNSTNLLLSYKDAIKRLERIEKENCDLKSKLQKLESHSSREPPKTDYNTLSVTDWLSDISENPFT